MRRIVAVLAATTAAALLTLGAPVTSPATAQSSLVVDDAVLTWGLNDESNNKAFAPGTFNFLSAGSVADPGRGGQRIVAPGVWNGTDVRAWNARRGPVRVEKRAADGTWSRARFAGLGTSADETPLTSTTGPFSGHRVVLSRGHGSIDPAAGTMEITWPGSFSVVYYSGSTFFSASDVTLEVAAGRARLFATLSGFAADRDDPETWTAVAPERVVLADLPGAELVSAEDGAGFTAQPSYLGVRYDSASGGKQVRSGPAWGAFPVSFLTYMERVGSAAFWYSSGGGADPHKVPLPITVSYDAADPVSEPDPPIPTAPPQPTTPVNPDPPATPTPSTSQPSTAPSTAPSAAPTNVVPLDPPPATTTAAPPTVGKPAFGTAPIPQSFTVSTSYAAPTTPRASPVGPLSAPTWIWWGGATLLLGAAALTLLTIRAKGTS